MAVSWDDWIRRIPVPEAVTEGPVHPSRKPDRVNLALWPHCLCVDPVVFGHVPFCAESLSRREYLEGTERYSKQCLEDSAGGTDD